MKLKKSLLALTTAATVAVAGSTAAVAEDTTNAGSTVADTENGTDNGGKTETEPNKDGDKEEPSKLAGSTDKFFGWDEDTDGLTKLKSVVTLVTTIGALVAGIVTLATNFGKIQNLIK